MTMENKKRIAIIGGGPSALFMLKRLVESGEEDLEIEIFEKSDKLGAGMPYSQAGANDEHVTNVSDNEIPTILTSIHEWLAVAPKELLQRFDITPEKFNEYKVLPRLFFGEYLSGQFHMLLKKAEEKKLNIKINLQQPVIDIIEDSVTNLISVETTQMINKSFDVCVLCTGHHWPTKYEGSVKGYFDSPYPPSKLALQLNHPVAIRGTSLTAIDAIRTLARNNGTFEKKEDGTLSYNLNQVSSGFKMILHSRSGLLPAIRFHLEDSHLSNHSQLTDSLIQENRKNNNGFLSLDFVFEKAFKEVFRDKDLDFYLTIKDLSLEEFVEKMMDLRERLDPFVLFKSEFKEAAKSIQRRESIYWKEMLAILSFTMNYPAKHFSAEDMQRLQAHLSHLISVVIAFVPQTSARELVALHEAGLLNIVAVGPENRIEIEQKGGVTYHYKDDENVMQSAYYHTFVDSMGQKHLSLEEFPFRSLLKNKSVSQARIKFRSAEAGEKELQNGNTNVEKDNNHTYYLRVPGISINDDFQLLDNYGALNERIFIMAVPYIGGFNPDYSGLDFCEEASKRIVSKIFR
ncbi:hypothetical protein CNR22_00695 [Sphingobacteriaceae bacterium]|nr:hypothetical protein CNR22_00695 [Sphingobacteriaceae bacterium]